MITFRILGLIAKLNLPDDSSETPQILEAGQGLRVEGWDKDENFDDRLGSNKANSLGLFEIQFTDEDFRQEDRELEGLPDIFFRVYRGSQLLGDTQGEEGQQILWNTAIVSSAPQLLNRMTNGEGQPLRVGATDYYIAAWGWIVP
ncbi:MAG: hypothetical protein SVX43_14810, partial [Cyanobacteriota bacterium]|nr:hypothetical protein [Cyanobacteriota bacterium]